jgi:hypothetical protein
MCTICAHLFLLATRRACHPLAEIHVLARSKLSFDLTLHRAMIPAIKVMLAAIILPANPIQSEDLSVPEPAIETGMSPGRLSLIRIGADGENIRKRRRARVRTTIPPLVQRRYRFLHRFRCDIVGVGSSCRDVCLREKVIAMRRDRFYQAPVEDAVNRLRRDLRLVAEDVET